MGSMLMPQTMKNIFNRFFLLLLITFSSYASYAAHIKGFIADENHALLPFVNVYIKGTTIGTTSNVNGEYALELKPGRYEIVYKMIGFKQHIESVDMNAEDLQMNVKLFTESYSLKEVMIKADAEDPAYAVIRQAMKKRKFYLHQVQAYSADVYIKGLQKITKHPKKFLGQDVDPEEMIDSVSGIVYLSESVSKFNFKKPNHIREEMISSKVSGDNKAFSYNQASDLLFNFYENILDLSSLSDRGFISPISSNALFSYRYKLLGTFFENNQMINKIQVIPKRKNDPVFSGVIYIAENTWRIHSLDLMLTKDANIDFVDTLHINQTFLPVKDEVWMVFSNKFTFDFSFMGFKGNGLFTGVQTNYNVTPEFSKSFFTNEVMKIKDEANKKDSVYWKETRPIPLTKEEKNDYRRKDSLMQIKKSKPYLDSLDRKSNKFKISNLFLGYTFENRFKKESYSVSSILQNVNFNTVNGWDIGLGLQYHKKLDEKNRSIHAGIDCHYGFSNQLIFTNLHARYEFKPQKFEWVEIGFGRQASQYNERQPIWDILNTFYTITSKQNFMKIFDKRFVKVSHNIEIVNGVALNSSIEYASRNPLLNTSNYSFVRNSREYTSNDPQNPVNNSEAFVSNKICNVDFLLTLNYKQKYYTSPNAKIILGSKYPTLSFRYKKSIAGILGSEMNYDLLTVILKDEIHMKLFGHGAWSVGAGRFLSKKKMQFLDYYHFMGNSSYFSNFSEDAFNLLEYYTYSTNDYYLMANYSHNFGGFFLNKIPLVRKLKLREIAEIKYLSTEKLSQYTELSIGIQKVFLRFDFVTSYSNNKKLLTGFRLGMYLN